MYVLMNLIMSCQNVTTTLINYLNFALHVTYMTFGDSIYTPLMKLVLLLQLLLISFFCQQLCGADKPYLSPETLKSKHEAIMKASLDEFRSKRKMGSSQVSQSYEDELVRKIEEAYESFVKRNESKHILYAYRTPAVLASIMVMSYLISSILDALGVESLSQTAIFGLYIPLILTLVWLYVKYSGDFREVGQFIDNVTSAVWEQVRM